MTFTKSARISQPAPRLLTPVRSSFDARLLHVGAPLPQHLVAELVGQLLLYLFHLPSFAVVAQRPCHLLIGHLFAVSFLDSPAMCQSLLVFGGKLECPFVSVHPPDTVLHVAVPQEVQQELVQADLLFVAFWKKTTKNWTLNQPSTGLLCNNHSIFCIIIQNNSLLVLL